MNLHNLNQQTSQHIIGLTGGIATGKTTVAEYLASVYRPPVLDADTYARQAVQPGSAALKAIIERYGHEILLANGSLDRHRLGSIVFGTPAERTWLEAQIHPYVWDCLEAGIHSLGQHQVVVAVVPLLFEANMTDLVTEIWVVYCSEAEQLQRLMQRGRSRSSSSSHLTLEQAQARIQSQMPIEQKMAQAAVILDNSSTPKALFRQVDLAMGQLHQSRTLGNRD